MEAVTKLKGMTLDELRSAYDTIANEYEQKLWFDQYILGAARLRKRLMSKSYGKILDVACGTGLNFPLFESGSDITAVDLSPGMLDIARQNAAKLGLNVNFALMNAERLEFADGSFNIVASALSTCTFPDPTRALREMQRVCRPGGLIILLEHGRSNLSLLARYQDHHAYRHYQENAGCHWNRDPLKLAQAAGLKVLTSRRAVLGLFYLIEATPGNK